MHGSIMSALIPCLNQAIRLCPVSMDMVPFRHGLPTLWQRTTPIIVGWLAGRTRKNNSNWYT